MDANSTWMKAKKCISPGAKLILEELNRLELQFCSEVYVVLKQGREGCNKVEERMLSRLYIIQYN